MVFSYRGDTEEQHFVYRGTDERLEERVAHKLDWSLTSRAKLNDTKYSFPILQ